MSAEASVFCLCKNCSSPNKFSHSLHYIKVWFRFVVVIVVDHLIYGVIFGAILIW